MTMTTARAMHALLATMADHKDGTWLNLASTVTTNPTMLPLVEMIYISSTGAAYAMPLPDLGYDTVSYRAATDVLRDWVRGAVEEASLVASLIPYAEHRRRVKEAYDKLANLEQQDMGQTGLYL